MSQLAIHGGTPVRTDAFAPQNTIGEAEKRAVIDVLDSGNLSQFLGEWSEDFHGGPRVRATEAAYAERLGAKHAISVNSATTGLHVALAAAGVGPGDEVIVSPFTMSASAAVVVLQNAIPVFADIEDVTYGLDPAAVEALITTRTKAIMVTHIFGHPARMAPLQKLATKHGLAIIEDAAQSIGATYHGKQSGTIGTAGVLSLNYHKIIHSGEGGIVLTDDDEVATIASLSRNHGEVVADRAPISSIANTVGSNFRMTEIEAAIAFVQLQKLDGLLELRRGLGLRLGDLLADIDGVNGATIADDCSHSFYVYPLRLTEAVLSEVPRAAVVEAMAAEGIPVSNGYVTPLYLQPIYQQRIARGTRGCPWTCGHWQGEVSYDRGICPVTERMHFSDLMLADVTRHPLVDKDVEDVAEALAKVLGDIDALRKIAAAQGASS